MRYKFRWDKKYLYWGITAFCVIAAAILFFLMITRFPDISGALNKLGKILSPFIWGLVITYLLTPIMLRMEKFLFLPLGKKLFKNTKTRGTRFARSVSILFSLLLFVAVLAALVYLIIPQLYESIKTIVERSPAFIDDLSKWIETRLTDYPEVETYVTNILVNANQSIVNWLNDAVLPKLGDFITSVGTGVYYVLVAVYNLLVGLVVSIYILGNLEKFKAGCKRLLFSMASLERADKFLDALSFTHRTFMGFISGKLLDSAIIGLICYVVCLILRMPYAPLVSIIIGLTNVIPFFGPFIGAVPCALFILMVDPFKCLIFIVFIIILQQVDGNIIGPKILGGTTGINGFWVLFSIVIGAGLFGFWGMLLGVPVFVVIYTFIDKLVKKRLERQDLPSDIEDYRSITRIDPVTHEVFRGAPKTDEADGADEAAEADAEA